MAGETPSGEPGETGEPTGDKQTPHAGEFVPPTDGSWIPRERLNASLDETRILKVELDKMKAEENKPREYSAKELEQAELDGELTREEVDSIKERQIENRILVKVKDELSTTSLVDKQVTEISRYEEALPDLQVEGSDLRNKVVEEYRHLTQMGLADNTGTMVAAIRGVAGPLSAIKATEGLTRHLSAVPETGGSGGNGQGGGDAKSKLTAREKDYYDNAIRRGGYPDWDAVFEERDKYGRNSKISE